MRTQDATLRKPKPKRKTYVKMDEERGGGAGGRNGSRHRRLFKVEIEISNRQGDLSKLEVLEKTTLEHRFLRL